MQQKAVGLFAVQVLTAGTIMKGHDHEGPFGHQGQYNEMWVAWQQPGDRSGLYSDAYRGPGLYLEGLWSPGPPKLR